MYTPSELEKAQHQVKEFLQDHQTPGGFKGALIEAIFKADCDNLDKLYSVYPEYVDAVRLHTTGYKHNELVEAKCRAMSVEEKCRALSEVLCHEDRVADDKEHQAEKRVVMVQHAGGGQEIDNGLK